MCVGLIQEPQNDPLLDVECLAACKLATTWGKGRVHVLKRGDKRAGEVVAAAKQNMDVLKAELERIRSEITIDPERASSLFEVTSRIDRYLVSFTTAARPAS